MTHEIEVQQWFSDQRKDAPYERHSHIKTVARWACSCGRIGPSVKLGLSMTSNRLAHRSAANGGARHVKAMEKRSH